MKRIPIIEKLGQIGIRSYRKEEWKEINDPDLPSGRFLIIRFSSIGDIVLTSPVVRCLKKQVPGAEVHYVTKKQYVPLLQANPYIDKIHIYDQDLSDLIERLKREKFDNLIDLHHNLRSLLLKLRLDIPAQSFQKLNLQKWMIVNFRIDLLPRIHIVDRYLQTLGKYKVQNDGKGLDYFIPSEDQLGKEVLPPEFHEDYIVLAAGTLHNTKQLPADRMCKLCDMLTKPIVILGGKEDFNKTEFIKKNSKATIYNGCGIFNLNQSASLIRQSLLVITFDTGIMHIASALRKKVLSLWGNTIPEFGMYPYLPHPQSEIFEVKGLSCRPCSKLGYPECPKGHFRCMNELPLGDIAAFANTF